MSNLVKKLKQLFSAVNRGLLKISDWITQSFRIGLVLGVVLYAVGIGWFVFFADKVSLENHTVLVLDLKGVLVEESPGGLKDRVVGEIQGNASNTIRLRDFMMTLELAAKDKRIDRALLKLDEFQGGGFVSLREASSAIEKFKASGKSVVAWSTMYDQRQYYLAAHANQVLVHPMGGVLIEGFGRPRNYYKDALDKLGISANLIRVGKFKSAGEPFVLNAPSQDALEAERHVFDALWSLYTQGVEKTRQLPAGSIAQNIARLPDALLDVKGDSAQLAIDWKWVDGLQSFGSLRDTLAKEVGIDEDIQSFRQVGWKDYLNSEIKKVKGDHIAVVVAQGEIGDGRAPPGKIGGVSTAEMIRKAANDDEVKAIILRVNSPGGSALGSELVREQLQVARDKGKPVVVSMGDVAASGGYWISLAADTVIADPATITGSIGVFAILPTGEGLMNKIGVSTGGYQTTWLAGAGDPRKSLDPRVQKLVQSGVEHIYADFTDKVSTARGMDLTKVDTLAQGRIWTGEQAAQHKLVDRSGSFSDAIDEARQKVAKSEGKLSDNAKTLPIRYIGPRISPLERLTQRFIERIGFSVSDPFVIPFWNRWAQGSGTDLTVLNSVGQDFGWLQDMLSKRQAFGVVTHCFCESSL